jgi:hypothetical protein
VASPPPRLRNRTSRPTLCTYVQHPASPWPSVRRSLCLCIPKIDVISFLARLLRLRRHTSFETAHFAAVFVRIAMEPCKLDGSRNSSPRLDLSISMSGAFYRVELISGAGISSTILGVIVTYDGSAKLTLLIPSYSLRPTRSNTS